MNKSLQCVLSNEIYVATFPSKLFVFHVLHHIECGVFLPYLGVIEINLSALELT